MPLEKTSFLNRAGLEVQHNYLVAFLRLLCRYQVLRMHTIAYGLFPLRTQSAALAAAQRVVSNAVKRKYVASVTWTNGRRYFALTGRGARFINELDPDFGARATISSLMSLNKEHREWGVLISMASEHRGMPGFSEALIAGQMHTDITTYFGHTPDAITLFGDIAVWHEVETSRRSTTRRAAAPRTMSGAEKLIHLVRTLRDAHHITHAGKQYPLALIMHCATDKIEREVRNLILTAIEPHGGTAVEEGFEVGFLRTAALDDVPDDMPEGGELSVPTDGPLMLQIVIDKLPATPEEAWTGVLPWAGCPGQPRGPLDEFIRR